MENKELKNNSILFFSITLLILLFFEFIYFYCIIGSEVSIDVIFLKEESKPSYMNLYSYLILELILIFIIFKNVRKIKKIILFELIITLIKIFIGYSFYSNQIAFTLFPEYNFFVIYFAFFSLFIRYIFILYFFSQKINYKFLFIGIFVCYLIILLKYSYFTNSIVSFIN